MRNSYKREDVFVCRHESHRGFDHRVSAYHVLIEKRCMPHGCIDFVWKCKRLDRGGACPKGYRHVGNNCAQCRFYDEEKVQRRPACLLGEAAYRDFVQDCRDFDAWTERLRGRRVEVGGRITDLRPHLIREIDGRRSRLVLRGFLVRLERGYVGLEGVEDPLYVRIGRRAQQRARLARGDRIDCLAEVGLDRGRLVATGVRRLEVEERGGEAPAAWEAALLSRLDAVAVPDQPERCLRCSRGVLVDVRELGREQRRPRRELLCLEGIGRPEDCPYEALVGLNASCPAACGSPAPAR
ncbi:MAG: hypothetical protein GF330_14340 [Candidatus Eisenbacteria bacterium]|nr:hypothetical protein [Candidatus Eisenbacteria bacterium]